MELLQLVINVVILLFVIIFIFLFIFLRNTIRIGDDEVGIVYKKSTIVPWHRRLRAGQLIALKGEIGWQADILTAGFYYGYWKWLYEVHKKPLAVIMPGQIGLVVAKDGQQLSPGQLLGSIVECDNFENGRSFLLNGGQKGPQLGILSEGTYRINTELFDIVTADDAERYNLTPQDLAIYTVDEGHIGIVTTLDGKSLPPGEIAGPDIKGHKSFQNLQKFIDNGGYKGIQEEYLTTGSYRLNPWFIKVKQIPLTHIPTGTVGVVISHIGKSFDKTTFNENKLVDSEYKGIWRIPLNSGRRPINTDIYDVVLVPTDTITLDWSRQKRSGNGYDTNFRPIQVGSSDEFKFEIEVTLVIRIKNTDAPKMIASVGYEDLIDESDTANTYRSMKRLVKEVIQPVVDYYFRDSAQTYKAEEFYSQHTTSKKAIDSIRNTLYGHGVEVIDMLIDNISLPDELKQSVQEQAITEQMREIFQQRQSIEADRQKLEKGKADFVLEIEELETQIKKYESQSKSETVALELMAQANSLKSKFNEVFLELNEADANHNAMETSVAINTLIDSIANSILEIDSVQLRLFLDTQDFFKEAGFDVKLNGGVTKFVCHPKEFIGPEEINSTESVYGQISVDVPLDRVMVEEIHNTAKQLPSATSIAFVIIQNDPKPSGWWQIAAYRSDNFNIVPIPQTIIYQSKASSDQESQLNKHLSRYLGNTLDPYDISWPVSDVLQFFGREALAKELITHLLKGHPIGIFGLRKIGKSSLMHYMEHQMPCPTARIDLQAGFNLGSSFMEIANAWAVDLQTKFKTKLDLDIFQPTSPTQISTVEFIQLVQRVLDRLEANSNVKNIRLAIFIDEIEYIVPVTDFHHDIHNEDCLLFMRTLRSLVQHDGRLSLMVAGFNPALNRISHWQNVQNPFYQLFKEVYVPHLHEDDCKQMIRRIGEQIRLEYTDEAADTIARNSAGHPLLVRQICSQALGKSDRRTHEIQLTTVMMALETLQFEYNSFPSQLWQQICSNHIWGKQIAETSRKVLLKLAKARETLTENELLDSGMSIVTLRHTLLFLIQMSVICIVGNSQNMTETKYRIGIELFKSWIKFNFLAGTVEDDDY